MNILAHPEEFASSKKQLEKNALTNVQVQQKEQRHQF